MHLAAACCTRRTAVRPSACLSLTSRTARARRSMASVTTSEQPSATAATQPRRRHPMRAVSRSASAPVKRKLQQPGVATRRTHNTPPRPSLHGPAPPPAQSTHAASLLPQAAASLFHSLSARCQLGWPITHSPLLSRCAVLRCAVLRTSSGRRPLLLVGWSAQLRSALHSLPPFSPLSLSPSLPPSHSRMHSSILPPSCAALPLRACPFSGLRHVQPYDFQHIVNAKKR